MIVIIIMIGGQMAACGAMGPVKVNVDNRRSSEHSRSFGTKKKITSALRLLLFFRFSAR